MSLTIPVRTTQIVEVTLSDREMRQVVAQYLRLNYRVNGGYSVSKNQMIGVDGMPTGDATPARRAALLIFKDLEAQADRGE